MNTLRVSTRRFEGGVQKEAHQGGLTPHRVQVLQDAQVSSQGDQVPIRGYGNEVPVVLPSYVCSIFGVKPKNQMSRFLICVSDIVRKDYHTAMIRGDMTLFRIMVYAQSIEESKLGRRTIDAKRGRNYEKVPLKFKKRVPIQDISSGPKSNYERGGGSQVVKNTCPICGKNHFVKYLAGTS
ncbi:hypothetical protein EJD97_006898 [Solanum chilense]|uniref:Uncharacterized protein n=1 Tax=Solanum chilense TaxID=4083 RepID=A0A6N2BS98_SOLCI|nr:hypothetical protein EJD97_006898 [Solanum chilense]